MTIIKKMLEKSVEICIVKPFKRVVNLPKTIVVSVCSTLLVSITMGFGLTYMNASSEITNEFLDTVIEHNKDFVPDVDKKALLISSEAQVEELNEFEATIVEGVSIKLLPIGQGTLIMGEASINEDLILTISSGQICNALTNSDGKFGCMFATSKLTLGDINVSYNK